MIFNRYALITKLFPPFYDIKPRAPFFFGILVMAVYFCLWEDAEKYFDKRDQRTFLCLGERVGRTATTVQTTHITDADAMLVMSINMSTHYFYRPTQMDGAVQMYDIMVANVVEASLQMPPANIFDRIVAMLTGGDAMDDDTIYFSHN